jgi:Serine dehydrogenase proteinase/HNH endonuclease
MSFDLSSLFRIFVVIMVLQPLLIGRWYALRRAQAIRAIEKSHGSRVITMIHRQEKRSLFGFAISRHIDLEDAQTIIAAIKETPDDMPIDLVIHTPGAVCSITHASLVKAAHICGKAHNGSDDWRNGIPLCSTHHDAYDAHLFAIDTDTLTIVMSPGVSPNEIGVAETVLAPLRFRPHAEALVWRLTHSRRSWAERPQEQD